MLSQGRKLATSRQCPPPPSVCWIGDRVWTKVNHNLAFQTPKITGNCNLKHKLVFSAVHTMWCGVWWKGALSRAHLGRPFPCRTLIQSACSKLLDGISERACWNKFLLFTCCSWFKRSSKNFTEKKTVNVFTKFSNIYTISQRWGTSSGQDHSIWSSR